MAEAAIRTTGVGREAVEEQENTVQGRNLGFFSIFIFALTGIGLTYSGLLPFSTIAGLVPKGNLLTIITVAMGFALVHAYVYAVIGSAAPRYGADYYVTSRVLSGSLAFASSFIMVVFFALAAGTIIASIPSSTIPMFSQIAKILIPDRASWDVLATVSSQNNVVLIGTVGVMLVFSLSILPPHWTHRFFLIAAVLSLVVWGIICYPMLTANSTSFSEAWSRYMGQGSYLDHLYKARQLGMHDNPGLSSELLAGLSFGFWLFYGYLNGTFFAKEVKKPEMNLLWGSWTAILVSWGVFALLVVLIYQMIPQPEWVSAESFLAQNPGFTGLAMPWAVFYSAILRPNFFIGGLTAITWGFGMLMMAHTFIYASSRIILAWANDHLLPESTNVIHPVLHSPIITSLLVSIIAVFGVLATALSGSHGLQAANPVLVMAVTQVLPVLAILVLPFRHRDWFERAPKIVRIKIGPVPLISLFALVSLAGLCWMIAAEIPSIASGETDVENLLIIIPSFLIALVWYYGRRWYLRKLGQDIVTGYQPEPGD